MKKVSALFLFACLVLHCSAGLGAVTPEADTKLVFIGTVTSITLEPLHNSMDNWVIVFHVDTVKSGAFAATTFSFRVHSPSSSRLEVGKVYTVEADRTETGYTARRWTMHTDKEEP